MESAIDSLRAFEGMWNLAHTFDLASSRERILEAEKLLGTWTPSPEYLAGGLSPSRRSREFLEAGFDGRLLGIPSTSFVEAMWAAGVGPLPRDRSDEDPHLAEAITLPPRNASIAREVISLLEEELRNEFGRRLEEHYGEKLRLRDSSDFKDLILIAEHGDHWAHCFSDVEMTGAEFVAEMGKLKALGNALSRGRGCHVLREEYAHCVVRVNWIFSAFDLATPWRVAGEELEH